MFFDWGSPNHKSRAMTSSEIFERETLCGKKILKNERSEVVAWFVTYPGFDALIGRRV